MRKSQFYTLLFLSLLIIETSLFANEIIGEKSESQAGYLVDFSDDGKLVLVGSRDQTSDLGKTQVFSISEDSLLNISSPNNFSIVEKVMTIGKVVVANQNKILQKGNTIPLLDTNSYGAGMASISGDGLTIAIHKSTFSDNNVELYRFSNNTWSLETSISLGSAPGGNATMDLDYDGDTIVIGCPRCSLSAATGNGFTAVYRNGSMIGEPFGIYKENGVTSVSISSNGNQVAIGSQNEGGSSSGTTVIYKYDSTSSDNTKWLAQSEIVGEQGREQSGYIVNLSDDGTRVAVSAPYNKDSSGSTRGLVRVLDLIDGIWKISGEFGPHSYKYGANETSMSLSGDGNTIAVASEGGDGQSACSYPGRVSIFKYNSSNSSWTSKGNAIHGQSPDDLFSCIHTQAEQAGWSLSLSQDGNRLSVGGPGYDPTPSRVDDGARWGRVRIFDFVAGEWVKERPVTFSISGEDSASIDINNVTGLLTFNDLTDYYSKNKYSIIVSVSDENTSISQDITINVEAENPLYCSDRNIQPTHACAEIQTISYPEGATFGGFNSVDLRGGAITWSWLSSVKSVETSVEAPSGYRLGKVGSPTTQVEAPDSLGSDCLTSTDKRYLEFIGGELKTTNGGVKYFDKGIIRINKIDNNFIGFPSTVPSPKIKTCKIFIHLAAIDSDADGISDPEETTQGTSPTSNDSDNDGTLDGEDPFPLDQNETIDTDNDGIGNNTDTDDDGDGVSDINDAFPLSSSETSDTDSDGVADNLDNCPAAANTNQSDTDGDGKGNECDSDDDGDGVLDVDDPFPLNSSESLDTDNDGIGNNTDTDDDNDGTLDASDALPLNATETVDTDSDGIGNNSDTDDDNDGILDGDDDYPLFVNTPASDFFTEIESYYSNFTLRQGTNNADTQESMFSSQNLSDNPSDKRTYEDAMGVRCDNYPWYFRDYNFALKFDEIWNGRDGDDYINIDNSFGSDKSVLVFGSFGDDAIYFDSTDLDLVVHGGSGTDKIDVETNTNSSWRERKLSIDEINSIQLFSVDTDNQFCSQNLKVYKIDLGNRIIFSIDSEFLVLRQNSILDNSGIKEEILDQSSSSWTGAYINKLYDAFNLDTDTDQIPNIIDTDDDGDGVLDVNDMLPLDSSETLDTDNDGIGNNADTDDDGDGVSDITDVFPLNSTEAFDTDSDGVGDNADNCPNKTNSNQTDTDSDGKGNECDSDDDGDGVLDVDDPFPLNSIESLDTDGDGIGNNADNDDDGDGVLDANDDLPLDSSDSIDTDGDGVGNDTDADDDNDGLQDDIDVFPLDINEQIDSDDDGIGNNADTDDDNDGISDTNDAFPFDDNETADTDGDGIGNNTDTDDDGDGVSDDLDVFPLDSTESVDTDSDNIGDNTDNDDDNDGTLDINDPYPLKAPPIIDFNYMGNTDTPLSEISLNHVDSKGTITALTTDINGQITLPATTDSPYTLSASFAKTWEDPISLLDAMWILQHGGELRTLTSDQLKAADVNEDGEVGVLDAIWIVQHLGELRTISPDLVFLDVASGLELSEVTFNPTDTPSVLVFIRGDVNQDFNPATISSASLNTKDLLIESEFNEISDDTKDYNLNDKDLNVNLFPGSLTNKISITRHNATTSKLDTNNTMESLEDYDGDGLPDAYELANGNDPYDRNDTTKDADGDGLTILEEFLLGTSDQNPDTDFDTLPDGWEVAQDRNPLLADYQISTGTESSCALTDNGVVCWGKDNGSLNVPTLYNPTAVAVGSTFACALENSEEICWGNNQESLIGKPSLTEGICAIEDNGIVCQNDVTFGSPPFIENAVQVSTGESSACALAPDGVTCWGYNLNGENDVPALVIDPDGDGYSNQGGVDAFPLDPTRW